MSISSFGNYEKTSKLPPINIQGTKMEETLGTQIQIPNIKKVIINPCLHPEVELELLKDENGEPCVPQHIVDFYKDYIKEHDVWEAFTNNDDTVFNNILSLSTVFFHKKA